MKILVAEDDVLSARVLARELESLGHEPAIFPDGKMAWQALQDGTYRMVITDWMMPGLDGPELCRRIRSLWRQGYIYVILLTSRGEHEDRQVAVRAGADDFLIKPLDKFELSIRLAGACRIIQMQTQLTEQNQVLTENQRELQMAKDIAEIAQKRSTQLFESLPIAGFTFDKEGTIFEWNDVASTVFSISPHEALSKKVWDLLGRDLVGQPEREQLRGVFDGHSFQKKSWHNDKRFFLVSGHPIYSHGGEITGAISTAMDVTREREAEAKIEQQYLELKDAHRELEIAKRRADALALLDPLTNIANHRAFQERLAHLVEEAKNGQPLGLAMVDVDHFKRFNDTYGHQAGDQVLKMVAQCLRDSLRRTDFVARYGGEEFCALFLGVDQDLAAQLCERLRAKIELIHTSYQRVTASFGLSTFGPQLQSAADLIDAADLALYRAKEQGRNRVVVFDESFCQDKAA